MKVENLQLLFPIGERVAPGAPARDRWLSLSFIGPVPTAMPWRQLVPAEAASSEWLLGFEAGKQYRVSLEWKGTEYHGKITNGAPSSDTGTGFQMCIRGETSTARMIQGSALVTLEKGSELLRTLSPPPSIFTPTRFRLEPAGIFVEGSLSSTFLNVGAFPLADPPLPGPSTALKLAWSIDTTGNIRKGWRLEARDFNQPDIWTSHHWVRHWLGTMRPALAHKSSQSLLESMEAKPRASCSVRLANTDQGLEWKAVDSGIYVVLGGRGVDEAGFEAPFLSGIMHQSKGIWETSKLWLGCVDPDSYNATEHPCRLRLEASSEGLRVLPGGVQGGEEEFGAVQLPLQARRTVEGKTISLDSHAWLCTATGWTTLELTTISKVPEPPKEPEEPLLPLASEKHDIHGGGPLKNSVLDVAAIHSRTVQDLPLDYGFQVQTLEGADIVVAQEIIKKSPIPILSVSFHGSLRMELHTPRLWFDDKAHGDEVKPTECFLPWLEAEPAPTQEVEELVLPRLTWARFVSKNVQEEKPPYLLAKLTNRTGEALELIISGEANRKLDPKITCWEPEDDLPLVQTFPYAPPREALKENPNPQSQPATDPTRRDADATFIELDGNRGLLPWRINSSADLVLPVTSPTLPVSPRRVGDAVISAASLIFLPGCDRYFLPTLPGVEMLVPPGGGAGPRDASQPWRFRHAVPVLDESFAEVGPHGASIAPDAALPWRRYIEVEDYTAFEFFPFNEKATATNARGWLPRSRNNVQGTLSLTNIKAELFGDKPTLTFTHAATGKSVVFSREREESASLRELRLKPDVACSTLPEVAMDPKGTFAIRNGGQPLCSTIFEETVDGHLVQRFATLDGQGHMTLEPLNSDDEYLALVSTEKTTNAEEKPRVERIVGRTGRIELLHTEQHKLVLDLVGTPLSREKTRTSPNPCYGQWQLHDGNYGWPTLFGFPFLPRELRKLGDKEVRIAGLILYEEWDGLQLDTGGEVVIVCKPDQNGWQVSLDTCDIDWSFRPQDDDHNTVNLIRLKAQSDKTGSINEVKELTCRTLSLELLQRLGAFRLCDQKSLAELRIAKGGFSLGKITFKDEEFTCELPELEISRGQSPVSPSAMFCWRLAADTGEYGPVLKQVFLLPVKQDDLAFHWYLDVTPAAFQKVVLKVHLEQVSVELGRVLLTTATSDDAVESACSSPLGKPSTAVGCAGLIFELSGQKDSEGSSLPRIRGLSLDLLVTLVGESEKNETGGAGEDSEKSRLFLETRVDITPLRNSPATVLRLKPEDITFELSGCLSLKNSLSLRQGAKNVTHRAEFFLDRFRLDPVTMFRLLAGKGPKLCDPILFGSGGRQVDVAGKDKVDQALDIIRFYPKTAVFVEGHASYESLDPFTDAELNKTFSSQRAEAVATLLAQKINTPEFTGNPLRVQAFGETRPTSGCHWDNPEALKTDRRVELVLNLELPVLATHTLEFGDGRRQVFQGPQKIRLLTAQRFLDVYVPVPRLYFAAKSTEFNPGLFDGYNGRIVAAYKEYLTQCNEVCIEGHSNGWVEDDDVDEKPLSKGRIKASLRALGLEGNSRVKTQSWGSARVAMTPSDDPNVKEFNQRVEIHFQRVDDPEALVIDAGAVFWLGNVVDPKASHEEPAVVYPKGDLQVQQQRIVAAAGDRPQQVLFAHCGQELRIASINLVQASTDSFMPGEQPLPPLARPDPKPTSTSPVAEWIGRTTSADWLSADWIEQAIAEQPVLLPAFRNLNDAFDPQLPWDLPWHLDKADEDQRRATYAAALQTSAENTLLRYPVRARFKLRDTSDNTAQDKSPKDIPALHLQLLGFGPEGLQRIGVRQLAQKAEQKAPDVKSKANEAVMSWVAEAFARHPTCLHGILIKDREKIEAVHAGFQARLEELEYAPQWRMGDMSSPQDPGWSNATWRPLLPPLPDGTSPRHHVAPDAKMRSMVFAADVVLPSDADQKAVSSTRFRLATMHEGVAWTGALRQACSFEDQGGGNGAGVFKWDEVPFSRDKGLGQASALSRLERPVPHEGTANGEPGKVVTLLPPLVDVIAWASRPGERMGTCLALEHASWSPSGKLERRIAPGSWLDLRRPRAMAGALESVGLTLLEKQSGYAHQGRFYLARLRLAQTVGASIKPAQHGCYGVFATAAGFTTSLPADGPGLALYRQEDVKQEDGKRIYDACEIHVIAGTDFAPQSQGARTELWLVTKDALKQIKEKLFDADAPGEKQHAKIGGLLLSGNAVSGCDDVVFCTFKLADSLTEWSEPEKDENSSGRLVLSGNDGYYIILVNLVEDQNHVWKTDTVHWVISLALANVNSVLHPPKLGFAMLRRSEKDKNAAVQLSGYGRLDAGNFEPLTPYVSTLSKDVISWKRECGISTLDRLPDGSDVTNNKPPFHYVPLLFGPGGEVIPEQ